jgi:hypothetical protein
MTRALHITRILLLLLCTFFSINLLAQQKYNVALLDTLQQIADSKTTSKYFARLYYQAIEATNRYAAKQPENVRSFIFGFESSFAPAFFRSHGNLISGKPQIFNWQPYYADTTLNPMQYEFIGMNAHINGDMWLALNEKYGFDTLQKYRKPLIRFQKALNPFFDSIYVTTGQYKKLRRLHLLTLGLDKVIGRKMVLHWRKRQVRLALLFHSDPKKCERRWKRTQHNMRRWNKFAVNWIK